MEKVLDHGYVKIIDSWGSDESIIEAARMSMDGTFRGWDIEGKLLERLYSHKHMSPFEMAGLIIEVQAPIFIFREWHRHRTQSYNEMSARYVPLPDVNYIPTVERIMMRGKGNKQASSTGVNISQENAEVFRSMLEQTYTAQQDFYTACLASGVPKELARIHLPVGRYSRMRASANLRNWLAFLTLRNHPDAQWEIQQYAKVVASIVNEKFPKTYELFLKHK